MMSKYAWSPGRMRRAQLTCGGRLHRSPAIELVAPPFADALVVEDLLDLTRGAFWQAGGRCNGPLQSRVAAVGVLGVEPGTLLAMGLGGGAEVPDPRLARTREQRVALRLVPGPVPDVRTGHVSDVGRLETQHRAEVRVVQRLPGTFETVRTEAVEVDPLLPVDRHDPWGGDIRLRELRHVSTP